jgi:hypothetical protein
VKLMTAGTADFIVVMFATVPREPGIAFVTAQAHAILCLDTGRRVGRETNNRRSFLSARDAAGMRATGTMAGFTLQLPLAEWPVRIRRHRMFGLKDGKHRLIGQVTREAGISTSSAVRNLGLV